MPSRLVLIAILAIVLAPLAGCGPGKLNESRNLSLDPGDAKAMDLPAVSKPQKLKIEFSSTDAEVTVLVFKESDAAGDDGLLSSDPKKAIEKKTGKGETFTVDIPENTATRVIVRGATKKTDVSLKVTN